MNLVFLYAFWVLRALFKDVLTIGSLRKIKIMSLSGEMDRHLCPETFQGDEARDMSPLPGEVLVVKEMRLSGVGGLVCRQPPKDQVSSSQISSAAPWTASALPPRARGGGGVGRGTCVNTKLFGPCGHWALCFQVRHTCRGVISNPGAPGFLGAAWPLGM